MFDNNKYYKKIIGQKYDELYQLDNYYIKEIMKLLCERLINVVMYTIGLFDTQLMYH